MKTRHLPFTAALLLLGGGLALSKAADPTLKVGDAAPKLETGKWVQGEPVKEFQQGKAYLVEFWATWCGPCRVSIPHLNELHNKYKDKGLVVIGQDVWERDEGLVEPFVKSMGKKMTYRVALDEKEGSEQGKMAESWMRAAGRNGIPSAFLVDTKGRVSWIGHPLELKEPLIEEVLAGEFDLKQAALQYETRRKNEAQLRSLYTKLNTALGQKKWDAASEQLAEVEKLTPAEDREHLDLMRFTILTGKKDYASAYKLAAQMSEAYRDNAMLQNQLAWQIATDEGIEQRDLKLADKIARRASVLTQEEDPGILDTVARIRFMLGEKEEAIALQEKAVQLAEGTQKKNFQAVLESYKKGELPSAQ